MTPSCTGTTTFCSVDISAAAVGRAHELAAAQGVTEVLQAAGFTDVTFIDVREPVYYGPDVAAALQWIRGFSAWLVTARRPD